MLNYSFNIIQIWIVPLTLLVATGVMSLLYDCIWKSACRLLKSGCKNEVWYRVYKPLICAVLFNYTVATVEFNGNMGNHFWLQCVLHVSTLSNRGFSNLLVLFYHQWKDHLFAFAFCFVPSAPLFLSLLLNRSVGTDKCLCCSITRAVL